MYITFSHITFSTVSLLCSSIWNLSISSFIQRFTRKLGTTDLTCAMQT